MSKDGDRLIEAQRQHKAARKGKGARRMASSTRSLAQQGKTAALLLAKPQECLHRCRQAIKILDNAIDTLVNDSDGSAFESAKWRECTAVRNYAAGQADIAVGHLYNKLKLSGRIA